MATTRTGNDRVSTAPQAAPTRERIVDAARRLFSERGTTATSMRHVAAESGVTVPGLYYHFASKADLIHAVFAAEGLERARENVIDHDLPGPVEARIRERARREFERLIEHAEFLRLMQRESVFGDPDARAVGTELRDEWRRQWREVLKGADDLSPDADLAAAALVITTFVWGLFVDFLTLGDQPTTARIPGFAAVVAPALRGVG